MKPHEMTPFQYWIHRHSGWLLIALILAPWAAIFGAVAYIRALS